MEKSADAFRTISEVAADLGVPQHVLRFWETRFPQIHPLKRAGGRRYYRPADVELLRAIRRLLYDEGYTIKGVQRLLAEQGPRAMRLVGSPIPLPPAERSVHSAEVEVPPPKAPGGGSEAAMDLRGADIAPEAADRVPGRDALREALACVDECRAILLAALRPPGA